MSVWDYCIPDPPLACPRCAGVLSGAETRNERSCFLVWQQGIAAPISQMIDPDLALPAEHRARLRLPREFDLLWGKCSLCGYRLRGPMRGTTDDSGVWQTLQLDSPPIPGTLLAFDWLQCPTCCDAFPIRPIKHLYICPSCQQLVRHESGDPYG